MENSLIDIKEHVKKYANVITSLINVDVGIVDKNMRRVTGTGLYKNIEGVLALGSVYQNTLKTGKTNIIRNPRQHELCSECLDKNRCREKLEIATPIYCRDEIVGVLGLVCFNDEQKEKILNALDSYLNFTKQIAEFIGIKFYEYQEEASQKEREETFNQIFNNMAKGVIVSNCNDIILMVNNIGLKKLKLTASPLGKNLKLISQNETIMNEEVFKLFIENSEYNVAGKIIPLALPNSKKANAFLFDDIQKINSSIVEIANADNTITLDNIIGNSPATIQLKENIKKVADSTSTVLITGESGTGKEVVAKAIHMNSNRADKPFIPVNCGAIPESLIESEFFGYSKGAFTGANPKGKIGFFEQADGGTIFLDEIGDMPLSLQVKLLRVLQEKTITPIGSNKIKKIDIRIIAATNKNLEELVSENKFREDLYYRLNVFPIYIPPLRERQKDIEELAVYFVEKYSHLFNTPSKRISKEVMDIFTSYTWPGNIRELKNIIEYIINVIDEKENIISEKHLPPKLIDNFENKGIKTLAEMEKEAIKNLLEKFGTSSKDKIKTAKALDISLATLYRKIKSYNL